MDTVTINPAGLAGKVNIPPSKSLSHRAVICAGLAEGISIIDNLILSEDIKATLSGIEALGASVEFINTGSLQETCTVRIKGNAGVKVQNDTINCNESGSTLRFLVPFAGLAGQSMTFTGRGELVQRPLDIYYEIFDRQGIEYSNNNGRLPLTVKGVLKPGTFRVKGNVSSQFITGLMLTLPLLDGNSKIEVTTPLQSKGYVELTLDVLEKFGIYIHNRDFREFGINGKQSYKSTNYQVEGDYSQAAFWLVAGLLGGEIVCNGLNLNSAQGDRDILSIVKRMGANIQAHQDFIKAVRSATHGTVIDASQCPDLVPVTAVLGALSTGTTKIVNAERLRIKESDRLRAISTELNKLGANVIELDDGLIIEGKESLKGGRVDSWNDHRIAMALAVASIKCTRPVIITRSGAVKKSYPHFWKDFISLGGDMEGSSSTQYTLL